MVERTIRKAQVISPFGPGAVFNFGDESFIALDTFHWPRTNSLRVLRLERLENLLGVEKFFEPPVAPKNSFSGSVVSNKSVPFMRFPTWLFCPNCRKMYKWSWKDEKNGETPKCGRCASNPNLAPMRFMAVCDQGHVTDVNWVAWAHSGSDGGRCERPDLVFQGLPNRGGGLGSLVVKCQTCGRSRDLGDITRKNALKSIRLGCPGKHPWQPIERKVECDRPLQVLQRGASNAYFPDVVSALDVSRESGTSSIELHDLNGLSLWDAAKGMYDPNEADVGLALKQILDMVGVQTGISSERLLSLLKEEMGAAGTSEARRYGSEEDLLREEWNVLREDPSESTGPLVTEVPDLDAFGSSLPDHEAPVWRDFRRMVSDLVLVERLRIVRALTGFRRLDPSGKKQSPSLRPNPSWLPGGEIFGEGVFIAFDLEQISEWERRVPERYTRKYREDHENSGYEFLPAPSPRFVLLHTFSHLLMRQLCFECGYSEASLSERIYCGDDMAGALIFTASSDSEGALGGLVREARPERFYGIAKTALFRAGWCSNDPICSELPAQGIRGLNRAACHACSLVAETSCAHANAMLDRSLVFGNGDVPGFFEKFVEKSIGCENEAAKSSRT